MAKTRIGSTQILDGGIKREDLNTTQAGQAVVAKILQGSGGVSLSSSGADSGTGDVTINIVPATLSSFGSVKITDSTSTSASDIAASASSVKAAWDLANHAHPYAASVHTHTFASLTSKPTTIAGYGITDTPWTAYLPLAGGTLTGDLNIKDGAAGGVHFHNGTGAIMTSVTANDIVFMGSREMRFSDSTNWDYNSWAGMSYLNATKVLYVGGPAGSKFTSNASPSAITIDMTLINSGVTSVSADTFIAGGGSSANWNTAYNHSQSSHPYLPLAGGTLSGQLTANGRIAVNGGSGSSYSTSDLEVISGRTGGPVIALHWAGIVASTIGIESNGRIAIKDNPGTGYENFIAKDITATSFSGAGTGLTGTASGLRVDGALKLWSVSHPNDFYISNSWDGTYWQLTSNHGSPVNVGRATKALRADGNFHLNDNYGNTIIGLYESTRYQGIYAMGDAYKLSADGTTPGSLYGLAWTHSNIGGQSKAALSHQLLIMEDGVTKTAIGSGIWTSGHVTTNGNFYGSGSGITGTASGLSIGGNAATATKLPILGYNVEGLTFNQTPNAFAGRDSGWASYLISNHGDGATYFNQTLIMPFYSSPQYSRLVGGAQSAVYDFWTSENFIAGTHYNILNTQANAGYVAAGGTNYNKVWATDAFGNPGWLAPSGGGSSTIIDDIKPTVIAGGTWYQPTEGILSVGIGTAWVEVGRNGYDGLDGADGAVFVSPLTTKGDLFVFGTGDNRLPLGTNNQVLTADNTQALGLKWANASTTVIDDVAPTVTSGGFWFNPLSSNMHVGVGSAWVSIIGERGIDGTDGVNGTSVIAASGTGTILSLTEIGGYYYNMASANSSTTYTTTGTTLGTFACVLINAATEPVVTGATKIKGSNFLANTNKSPFVVRGETKTAPSAPSKPS